MHKVWFEPIQPYFDFMIRDKTEITNRCLSSTKSLLKVSIIRGSADIKITYDIWEQFSTSTGIKSKHLFQTLLKNQEQK